MRWIMSLVLGLALLAGLAVAALFLLPSDRIAALAADRIAAATGREVVIAGDVRPTLFPSLGVRAEDFTIGNPDWVDAGPMIEAEALAVSVPWRAVFAGAIEVEDLTLIAPRVILVRAADGRSSWSFDGDPDAAAAADAPPTDARADETAPPSAGPALRLALDRAVLRDGQVTFLDLAADRRIDITDVTAEIRLPASGVARLSAEAAINGATASVTAELDGVADLLDGGVRPVLASLDWQGGSAGFEGRMALTPAAEGRFSLDARDLGPVLALAGQDAPDLPAGLGRDRIVAAGQLTLTEAGTLHLREGSVMLDDNALSVDLDVTPGSDRPSLRGTVTAEALVLPASAGGGGGDGTGGGGGTAGGSSAGGWSSAPIDTSGLFAADAEIGLRLGRLSAGDTTLAPLNARVTNDAGRAVIDIENAGLYGGTLAGQVVVNGRGGLSARTDLILAGVQLQPLLSATAGYDRLEGSGSISLQVLGAGNSVAALMSSLDGQGDFAFGSGAIIGLDIAGMIRNFDTSFRGPGQRTVYDSVTASFTITDGVLANDDLELTAPWGGITGAGTVNLGAQTLNYRVIPGVLRDDTGATDINVPVLISGPWSAPSYQPDLAYLAEQDLSEQADRLGDAAREAVGDALGTELPGGGLDEIGPALDDALREEAEGALQRLLGGN